MHRSRFTQSCNPDLRAAARGALLAKTIAAVAVLCGILMIAVYAPREVRSQADEGQLGGRAVPSAAPTEAVDGTDARAPGRDPDDPLRLDPPRRDDHWSNVQG